MSFPSPHTFASLTNCIVCSQPLQNPTTLHCAHSVCAHHSPAQCCTNSTPPPVSTTPNIHPASRVRFVPAPEQPAPVPAQEEPHQDPPARRVDVTLSKVISLVSRAQFWIDEEAQRAEWANARAPDTEDLTDDEDDDDNDEQQPGPSSQLRRPRSASVISNRSDSHRPRKRRRRHGSGSASDDDQQQQTQQSQPQQPQQPARSPPRESPLPEEDPDGDLLTHLRQQSARQRVIRPDQPLWTSEPSQPPPPPPPDSGALDRFEKELLSELTCGMCFMLIYEPVTTACQHTFCGKCLHRSLDHSPACPLCRYDLPRYQEFRDRPSACNKTLLAIILHAFPEAYAERGETLDAEERDARLDTPIFVAQLSFPGMPTLLHFFEPRYRLMLRRCLESPLPHFGMILPPRTGAPDPTADYGTMLEIRSVQMLPDGRSMVETWGVYRFRILERGTLDGYMVGRVERVDDINEDAETRDEEEVPAELVAAPRTPSTLSRIAATLTRSSRSPPASTTASISGDQPRNNNNSSTARSTPSPRPNPPQQQPQQHIPSNIELMTTCQNFLTQLRAGIAPWVVQRLNNTYGPMPADPSAFSFWVALVLPIDEHEKAKLLPIRSASMRLRLVCWWITQLNDQWWFRSGCVII